MAELGHEPCFPSMPILVPHHSTTSQRNDGIWALPEVGFAHETLEALPSCPTPAHSSSQWVCSGSFLQQW